MGQQDKDKGVKDPCPINLNSSASQLVSKFSPQALLAVNIVLEYSSGSLCKFLQTKPMFVSH